MKPWIKSCSVAMSLTLAIAGCSPQKDEARMSETKKTESPLASKIRRFAPTDIVADVSHLSENDRKALARLIDAARLLDPLYLRQVWSGNEALLKKLEGDTTSEGRERLHYFMINKCPWSRLDKNEPFIDGVPHEKPPQAGFYPDDLTKDEFNTWVAGLSERERQRATGFFTVIRRGADGKLKIVPYHEEYGEFLKPAARLLKEAAELTENATLKNFLTRRAEAFLTDDYYASDVAWMDLDAAIDVTIGPYETYEDELFGYKAAFEAFVTVRDEAESAKLARFSGYLQELEDNLPVDPKYRNPKLGAASPIRVVDVVYTSADGNHGVQTAAFNLPNDEKVVKEKGSKRVMLKNVQEAKSSKVLVPISKILIDPSQQSQISFEAFFTHILAHELMHGLGPHNVKVGGRDTSVRKELKELYSAIEEAKADVTGLWALQYLIDKGVVDRAMERDMYTTYLASSFRSVRFGINEAHGKGQALQFNYLVDEGAIRIDEAAGTFSIDSAKIKDAVRKLTYEILTLQAEGSYDKAKTMLDRYGVIRPVMQNALDKLADVPVDIEPVYPLAKSR
jgi:peptidase M49-like protein